MSNTHFEYSNKFDSPYSHGGTHIILRTVGPGPVQRIATGRQQALFETLLPIVTKGTYQAVKSS